MYGYCKYIMLYDDIIIIYCIYIVYVYVYKKMKFSCNGSNKLHVIKAKGYKINLI